MISEVKKSAQLTIESLTIENQNLRDQLKSL